MVAKSKEGMMKDLLNILKNLSQDEWKVLEVLTGISPGDIGSHIKDDRDANHFLTLDASKPGDKGGEKPVISPERMLAVVKAVVKDGYDISEFYLYDIPEPHVLRFCGEQEEKFDIILWDGQCVVAYGVRDTENPGRLLLMEAPSISEAIEKYKECGEKA